MKSTAWYAISSFIIPILAYDPLRYVDPLIGSSNGGVSPETMAKLVADWHPGNVFAGATLPYGLAKAVADTDSGSNQGGFTLVCRHSHKHLAQVPLKRASSILMLASTH